MLALPTHYNSDRVGSLHATAHSRSSNLKILEVWGWKISLQTRQIFFSQFSLQNLRHTCLLNIVVSPVAVVVEVAQLCTRLVDSGSSNVDHSVSGRKVVLLHIDCLYIRFAESRLEGWLSVPNKQNIRRHGWKKQYVVVSSKKIIFYNSENDKQNTDPVLILDLKWVTVMCHFTVSMPGLLCLFTWPASVCYSKVFHVRSVTQGDVIRADPTDIPRIFQVRAIGDI
jgi:hypothetical protein